MTVQHITEKELAKRWGLSHRTLQRWRACGEKLSHIRIGGRIRYTLEAIEQFEAKHNNGSTGKLSVTPSLPQEALIQEAV
ncbi:MAG: helix-turn-helix domain-containing protein [Proteobacteria bacterium]|nr:helix-turn-helix domain-containing protein [Pseudomonadota bacterium]